MASRAYFKLEEALDLAGVGDLHGSHALDLGAAPGGWTEVLLDRGASVVAVDPGALDESVATRPEQSLTWFFVDPGSVKNADETDTGFRTADVKSNSRISAA